MPRPKNQLFDKLLTGMSDEELWKHYEACLRAHDWEHHYTDDHQVWLLGRDEASYIAKLKQRVSALDIERAGALYRTRGRS